MPIRKELRKYYGPAWRQYRLVLIETLGTNCSVCGRAVPKWLNFAHLNHNPRDNAHVAPMCVACHSRHDSHQRWAMTRRTWARRDGQLWLSVELEFAPYPDSFWPKRAIAARQLSLW